MSDPKRNLGDPFNEGPEAARARRNRSLAIAAGLIAFMVVVFIVTLVRIGGNGVP